MDKRRNKKAILIALAIALASTTSCGKNQKEQFIIETIDNEVDPLSENPTFCSFYNGYLERYGEFFSKEQYDIFVALKDGSITKDEEIIKKLDELFNVRKERDGRGIYRAFNTRMVYENVFPANVYYDTVYEEFNTLRSVVHNDKDFYKPLFSLDIDGFIDCIQRNTGVNRDVVEELILKLDAYSDIRESEEYEDLELKEAYEKRIQELMHLIVSSKLKNDPDFAKTLYGELLAKSRYMNEYKVGVARDNLFSDGLNIGVFRNYDLCGFTINSGYTYSGYNLKEMKRNKVCEIIEASLNEENTYAFDAMTFMIHLIDIDEFNVAGRLTGAGKREIMYESLREYFKDDEDFDTFFLAIADHEAMTFYEYFHILEEQIKKGGITDEDFIRFTSLSTFLNSKLSLFIDWNRDLEYPPYEEIKKMPQGEYEKVVRSSAEVDILYGMDYKMCMGDIYSLLKDNNLGYEEMYCPDCCYTQDDCYIELNFPSPCVLSSEIYPVEGRFNGTKVIYYEIPKGYESGFAVTSFYNIEREFTLNNVEGFKENFFDEANKKDVSAFIVSLDESLTSDSPYGPIRFMEYYKYFQEAKAKKNKELKLGDK